jgi:hypothetical protein
MVTVQEAPGELEDVRTLLNTWSIPNDTRRPTDAYDGPDEVRALRDDLRRAVERAAPEAIDPWITRLRVRPVVRAGRIGWTGRGAGADVLGTVLTAIADGTWPRLKACPDCRWVFYDHTRNGSKRWCLMTAGGPDGRSCGSIAKVRAHRQRHASA